MVGSDRGPENLGGADVCCGLGFGNGEEALIVELGVLGTEGIPRLFDGKFHVLFDYGEVEGCSGLSIKEAELEPGVCGDSSDSRMTAHFTGGGRSRVSAG